MIKPDSYYAGYESKKLEIAGMGFAAARDKFNGENPMGYKSPTADGWWFAHGEFDALCKHLER